MIVFLETCSQKMVSNSCLVSSSRGNVAMETFRSFVWLVNLWMKFRGSHWDGSPKGTQVAHFASWNWRELSPFGCVSPKNIPIERIWVRDFAHTFWNSLQSEAVLQQDPRWQPSNGSKARLPLLEFPGRIIVIGSAEVPLGEVLALECVLGD